MYSFWAAMKMIIAMTILMSGTKKPQAKLTSCWM